MPDALNEKHVGGSRRPGPLVVKVLPCIANTSNKGRKVTFMSYGNGPWKYWKARSNGHRHGLLFFFSGTLLLLFSLYKL